MDLLRYTDLIAALLNAVIFVAVAALARRHGVLRSGMTVGVLAFFALRVIARLNDSPELLLRDNPKVEVIVDLLTVAVMVYLLSRVRFMGRVLQAMLDEAHYRADEYERAKHHYTQVIRHRMFNPLTVIEGSALTLKSEIGQRAEVREQLCDAVLAMAKELRTVSLEPERRDRLEHELDAVPRVDDEAG